MAKKTWNTLADWAGGVAKNLDLLSEPGIVKLARPEPAQFTRNSPAYLDGTLVATGSPRYMGAGVMVEMGGENLAPSPDDLTVNLGLGAAELTAYKDRAVYTGTPYGNLRKCDIVADGGALTAFVEARGDAGQIRLGLYDRATATYLKAQVFTLTGASKKFEISVPTTTSGNTISFNVAFYPGTTYVDWTQLERKTYATSRANGTRAPETCSLPTLFGAEGGVLEFKADINAMSKRQVAGEYPALLWICRADGNRGLTITHSPDKAEYELRTDDDAGNHTAVKFADSLIPNGIREIKPIVTKEAVVLHCDRAPIATLNNPALPTKWGRSWFGSTSAGLHHAGASFGNIKFTVEV